MTRVKAGCKANGCEHEAVSLFQEYAHLAPSWCHEIEIDYAPEDGDSAYTLLIQPDPQYRRALVFLGTNWWLRDETYRRRAIVHEIGHLYVAQLGALMDHLIEILTDDDEKLRKSLEWQREQAEEAGVEDFAALVCRLVGVE